MLVFVLLACGGGDKAPAPVEAVEEFDESSEGTESSVSVGVSPRMHRLTHPQWARSISDLLGIEAAVYSEQFIDDTLSSAFENNGDSLSVGAILFQDYQRAAEGLARQVVTDLERYALVVPEDPREGGTAIAYTEQFEAEEAAATTGGVSGDRYNLWSNGTLSVEVELPADGLYVVTALVEGTTCDDGLGAALQLWVDGIAIASATVLEEQEVSATTMMTAGRHTLSITFENDCYYPDQGFDRNLLIDWIAVTGGIDLGHSSTTVAQMSSWVERFGARAFRRPLTVDELQVWTSFFARGRTLIASGDDIADGVELVITAMLQSPDFLYRIERTPAGEELNNYELAAKLSFQLCNQPPDEELRLAIDGDLVGEIRYHAERLINSDCGRENIWDLHRQLLHVDSYDNIYKSDSLWNPELNAMMKREMEEFILWHLYIENGTVRELYSAPYTVANDELAALYGAQGTAEFTRIELDPDQRAGLLTMSGFLAREADASQSSPIHRGVFINTSVLCKTLPPPPDDVTGLPQQEEGMTNRERVEAHTGEGTCGEGCHSALINPPGFAFEHYDQLGRYRTEDNGRPVDSSDAFYFTEQGWTTWTTGVEFAHHVANSQEAHSCYAEHLYSYLLGREIQEVDEVNVESTTARSLSDVPILELIVDIVTSESFRYRGVE